MKTLFLGDFGARVSAPVLAKAVEKFDATVLGDLGDTQRLIPALAEAEIVVGHIWKAALYCALRDRRIGGAALDVWWRYPTPAEPNARPSNLPFHELPNVLMTPHCSSATDGARDRRLSVIASNLDRYARSEPLANIVAMT